MNTTALFRYQHWEAAHVWSLANCFSGGKDDQQAMGFFCGFKVPSLSVTLKPAKYICVQRLIVFLGSRDISRDIALGSYNQLLPFKIPLFWLNTVYSNCVAVPPSTSHGLKHLFSICAICQSTETPVMHTGSLSKRYMTNSVTYSNYLTCLSTIWCYALFRRAEQVQWILLDREEGFFFLCEKLRVLSTQQMDRLQEFTLARNSLSWVIAP